MDMLLIFFALPIATILLAIVLQKILKSPILVGITFFAIYLIVTFAAFDSSFLIVAIILAILAYITAVLVSVICRILKRLKQCEDNNNDGNDNNNNNNGGCGCTRRSNLVAYTTQLIPNNTVILGTNSNNDSNDLGDNTNNNNNGSNCNCCRCRRNR